MPQILLVPSSSNTTPHPSAPSPPVPISTNAINCSTKAIPSLPTVASDFASSDFSAGNVNEQGGKIEI